MGLKGRLGALERAAERVRERGGCRSGAVDVCARIAELTVLYAAHPPVLPVLPPAVEAGIRALLARPEPGAGSEQRAEPGGGGTAG